MITASLTPAEAREETKRLKPQIEKYAELLIRKGVNVKQGQEVVIQSPVECADFARIAVEKAYEAGAGHVTVIWSDDAVTRLTYENVEKSWFEQTPSWKREQLDSLAALGACFLFIEGSDPEALKGIDPSKPATASHARNTQCKTFRHGLDFNINPWCIAGVPVLAWAKQVFPKAEDDVAMYQLWKAILSTARADGEDPQSDWELHDATFDKNLRFMNRHHFDRLRYRSKNGTDLTIGMTAGHIWAGGKGETPEGHPFFPNIPTEEVFTSPDRNRADGTVYSAMPLIHNGNKVEDFWLKFEHGVVVDYDARIGKDTLKSILDTDEGAKHLGEVALISKNTPIRQSGILFYDTLYDENASCHLALGVGFAECHEGGYEMTQEELLEAGVNASSTHVDFMIGADDLEITGITTAGEEIPVFVNGQWGWE